MKRYPFGDKILVSAHRGLGGVGIENTLAAFKIAIECGADMIETDVRMTRDGHIVLMHDKDVSRTTDGEGEVKNLTLAEIKSLNATANAKIEVASEAPPTLSEFLSLMKAHPNILLNIELKDYPEDGEDFAYLSADTVCNEIIKSGLSERVWINSFSGRLLEYVYKKHGETFYYHGFYPWFILGDMEIAPESFIDLACMQHRIKDENGRIEKCKDNACPREWFDYLLSKGIMPLMAPSLKEFPLYDEAFSYGSRIVNTDDPKAMILHLKSKKI